MDTKPGATNGEGLTAFGGTWFAVSPTGNPIRPQAPAAPSLGVEWGILALAVVYAWYMTAWAANWLDATRMPVRLLLVGLMFASLLMSAAMRRLGLPVPSLR